jgi:hypothetical protein
MYERLHLVQSAAGEKLNVSRETVYHNDDVDVAVLVRRKGPNVSI